MLTTIILGLFVIIALVIYSACVVAAHADRQSDEMYRNHIRRNGGHHDRK